MLKTENQLSLKEGDLALNIYQNRIFLPEEDTALSISFSYNTIMDKSEDSVFEGSFGVYYREIFHYIPWAIASHLNARGRYADAQRWYHYLFDPTAPGDDSKNSIAQSDRMLRFAGFRANTAENLRRILLNPETLDAYRNDPFNPHAIARTRISAYAKAAVLHYVENLLDWGDDLFTRSTTESIREASHLYALARDILGPRPEELGSCGENEEPLTYRDLEERSEVVSPFLRELEHTVLLGVADDPGIRALENHTARFSSERGHGDNAVRATTPTSKVRPSAAHADAPPPTVASIFAATSARNPKFVSPEWAVSPTNERVTMATTNTFNKTTARSATAIRSSHGRNSRSLEAGSTTIPSGFSQAELFSSDNQGSGGSSHIGVLLGRAGGRGLEAQTFVPSIGLDIIRQTGPCILLPTQSAPDGRLEPRG